ncbi:MAG: ATP-binding cassette domain-containing protein [Promethearchaeota archaeon]
MSELLYIIKDLSLSYLNHGIQYIVLNDISFQIYSGDFIAIEGPSGSGKTSLLKCLYGYLKPYSGSVMWKKTEMYNCMDNGSHYNPMDLIRENNISFLYQDYQLIDGISVLENIYFPLAIKNKKYGQYKEKIEFYSNFLEINDKLNVIVNNLSGGEKQRVALLRALIQEPTLLLADEPTCFLDLDNTEKLINLLRKINEELNLTIIFSTHDPMVYKKAKRVIELKNEKIILKS